MKTLRIFFLLCILGLSYSGNSQTRFYAQTMDNQTISICDSSKCIMIYYESGGCSLCSKVLFSFCDYFVKNNRNIQFLVMIKGSINDVLGMRSNTTNLQNNFPNMNFKIIYDIEDNQRKPFYKKFNISTFPAVFFIDNKNNHIKHIPYKKIFKNSELIEVSNYLKTFANDFIKK
ncbi:MAG: hypothetical protein PHI52_08555 [Bacteroidales bacterium]|nr:hypothetical protein [Bacteroidales bacterium]